MNSSAFFSVSPAGDMVYYPTSPNGPLVLSWYDRDGKERDTLDVSGYITGISLSPDGTRAVVPIYSTDGLSEDLWSFDLSRGTKTRLTSGPKSKQSPVWQPDGQFLLFSSAFTLEPGDLDRIRSDGSGGVETVLSSDDGTRKFPGSVCSDGRYLAFSRRLIGSRTQGPLSTWILPLTGDKKPFALVQNQFSNSDPRFSPDCKWVAYASNASGRYEVYLTPFPDATRIYQVSTQGGVQPQWRSDGKELFYAARLPGGDMMAVNVAEKADGIALGTPRTLFHLDRTGRFTFYDVTRDGQHFLISTSNYPPIPVPLTLVTNWEAELKKK